MISDFSIAVITKPNTSTPSALQMDNNRILRVLNVYLLSCGNQFYWFDADARKFRFTLVTFAYFVCLVLWYSICFEQHFTELSMFGFLEDMAPILYKCIRLHLLMGMKVMLYSVFEARYIVRRLNDFVKALPESERINWPWREGVAYFWLFSGLLWNFGFTLYVMIQMEFLRPTLRQIMHFTAMFLPHFALGCSVKLQNIVSWICLTEIQKFRSDVVGAGVYGAENNNTHSIELTEMSATPKVTQTSRTLLATLTGQLEVVGKAAQAVNRALQNQLLFLAVMNSVCLLGATYSVVYYESSWHLLLQGPLGRSFMSLNIGIFVFIFWDYLCLCATNSLLEREKSKFLDQIEEMQRKDRPTLETETKSLLKYTKKTLRKRFDMKIFFNSAISLKTFLVVNTLIGLAIALYTIYRYLRDQIENLQLQLKED